MCKRPEENMSATGDVNEQIDAQHHDHGKFAIPTTQDEYNEVEERCGKDSWQMKAVHFINSHFIQRLLIALLLMDVLILFVELYLDASYPSCSIIERDAISCCPADGAAAGNGAHFRFLSGGDEGHHHVCESPLIDYPDTAGCDGHKHSGVHTAHTALVIATLVILGIFLFELTVLLLCLGPRVFCSKFLYMLDMFVVALSFSLEMFFFTVDSTTLASLSGLLVIARIWRFVRIGHGLVATTHELAHEKEVKHLARTKELEDFIEKNGLEVPEQEKHGHGKDSETDDFEEHI